MQTSSIASFERVVSLPRLNSYKVYFKAKTMDEVIGLYLWNGEISSCFALHLSYFEIALRNGVHRAMSLFHSQGQSTSCHWYDLTWQTLKQASRNRISAVRDRRIGNRPSPDEMVASLSFGFWSVILNNISVAHASRIFPAIFPHHPLSKTPEQWSDMRQRRAALNFVFELQAFRNRLAHHEPLWKFRGIKAAPGSPPSGGVPAIRTEGDSIERLRRLMTMLEDGTGYVDQSMRDDLKRASWRQRLDFLLTERGIQRYRAGLHTPGGTALTPTQFRHRFGLIGRSNRPVRVQRSHATGIFVPD